MSNSWFRFKQFIVHQDRAGMKVSTDACIQGAWTPVPSNTNRILDIGCGTGLLSLMLAQRYAGVNIDGIEIEESAARQAEENVAASHWKEQIQILMGDVRTYAFEHRYDMVICNPPFFSRDLQSDDLNRNLARHDLFLSQSDLINVIEKLLNPEGQASILLPVRAYSSWERLVREHGFYIQRLLSVRHAPNKSPNRIISILGRQKVDSPEQEELMIYTEEGSYSDRFRALLQSFYLNL